MVDGIIKGTGNSRYLRSVPNVKALYSSFDAFLDALAAGTFPIDLNGINPAGWAQTGTKLDKASLLTDVTATRLGLTSAATPDQAIEKLRQMVASMPHIATGSYIGTGTSGKENPNTLTFDFPPKVLFVFINGKISGRASEISSTPAFVFTDSLTNVYQDVYFGVPTLPSNNTNVMKKDGNAISWYIKNPSTNPYNDAQYQLNYFNPNPAPGAGVLYTYYALG